MAPFQGGSYICGPVLVRFPVLRTQKTDLTISMFFDLNPEQEIHAKRSRDMRPVHTQSGKNRVGRISEIPCVKQKEKRVRRNVASGPVLGKKRSYLRCSLPPSDKKNRKVIRRISSLRSTLPNEFDHFPDYYTDEAILMTPNKFLAAALNSINRHHSPRGPLASVRSL